MPFKSNTCGLIALPASFKGSAHGDVRSIKLNRMVAA